MTPDETINLLVRKIILLEAENERLKADALNRRSARDLPFNFGRKHYGEPIRRIPEAYLLWFLDTVDGFDTLKNAVRLHLGID